MRNKSTAILSGLAAIALAGCATSAQQPSPRTGGNPARGAAAIRRYGCGACHTIPGISGAHGLVGPSLTGVTSRSYIAGLSNEPGNLERWIQHPHALKNPTSMPDLGVTQQDATDIAAYLYSLN